MWKGRRRELWPYHERQMVSAFDVLNCITPYTFLTSLLRLLVKVLSPSPSLTLLCTIHQQCKTSI